MTRKLQIALALAAALFAWSPEAKADAYMCAPDVSGSQTGPRTVTNPTTSPQSAAKIYQLNGRGCAFILPNDVAWFLSQGFTVTPSGGAIAVGPLVTNSPSPTVTIPGRSFIENIVVFNGGTGAVSTGGVRVGTTQTGTDVVALISGSALDVSISLPSTTVVAASAGGQQVISSITSGASVLGKRTFFAPTTLFIDTPGAWATKASDVAVSASAFVTIFYSSF